jgi:hypothetical protein
MSNTYLKNIRMVRCTGSDSSLKKCDLSYAWMIGSDITAFDLTDADLTEITLPNGEKFDFFRKVTLPTFQEWLTQNEMTFDIPVSLKETYTLFQYLSSQGHLYE